MSFYDKHRIVIDCTAIALIYQLAVEQYLFLPLPGVSDSLSIALLRALALLHLLVQLFLLKQHSARHFAHSVLRLSSLYMFVAGICYWPFWLWVAFGSAVAVITVGLLLREKKAALPRLRTVWTVSAVLALAVFFFGFANDAPINHILSYRMSLS